MSARASLLRFAPIVASCAATATCPALPAAADDPCASLFALVSRPTVTTSSCVVKRKDALVEFGYQNATLAPSGNSSTVPNAALRIGLARNLEADALVPTFTRSSQPIAAGFGDAAGGLKYQFGYAKNTINAVNVFFTGATGAKAFSGGSGGTTVSYDVTYALSKKFGLSGTLGYDSFALQGAGPGPGRYSSLNPSLVIANTFMTTVQGFIEMYGATTSGPHRGGNYCFDGGFQGDVSPHVQLDGSLGTTCTNIVGRPAHFVSFGGAFKL